MLIYWLLGLFYRKVAQLTLVSPTRSGPADTRKAALSSGRHKASESVTSYYSTTEATSSSSTIESTVTPFNSRESRRSSESCLYEGADKGVELAVGYYDRPSQDARLPRIDERTYTKSKTPQESYSMYRCV